MSTGDKPEGARRVDTHALINARRAILDQARADMRETKPVPEHYSSTSKGLAVQLAQIAAGGGRLLDESEEIDLTGGEEKILARLADAGLLEREYAKVLREAAAKAIKEVAFRESVNALPNQTGSPLPTAAELRIDRAVVWVDVDYKSRKGLAANASRPDREKPESVAEPLAPPWWWTFVPSWHATVTGETRGRHEAVEATGGSETVDVTLAFDVTLGRSGDVWEGSGRVRHASTWFYEPLNWHARATYSGRGECGIYVSFFVRDGLGEIGYFIGDQIKGQCVTVGIDPYTEATLIDPWEAGEMAADEGFTMPDEPSEIRTACSHRADWWKGVVDSYTLSLVPNFGGGGGAIPQGGGNKKDGPYDPQGDLQNPIYGMCNGFPIEDEDAFDRYSAKWLDRRVEAEHWAALKATFLRLRDAVDWKMMHPCLARFERAIFVELLRAGQKP